MSRNESGEDRGYVRVSTLKDSQKDSPEHQEALLREHTKRMGLNLGRVYQDRDSATSIVSREDVQEMIQDAKKGEIRSLSFVSLSRFSRDQLDAISLKRILVNALKIRVISIEDGYDSAVKDDELLFGIKSAVNQNTSGDISISSRRGIRQSALKGNFIGSIAPYGYKKVVVDGRKTLEVVPEKAAVVRQIFDLYVGAMGVKEITKYLNGERADGSVGLQIPSPKGGVWGISTVQTILNNETYTGYNVAGKNTVEIAYDDITDLMNRRKKQVRTTPDKWIKSEEPTHEAIILPELFVLAQETRTLRGGASKGGKRTFTNLFAKYMFCAECGSSIVSMLSRSERGAKDYRYLMCSRRRRTGQAGCSNSKWIPYYELRDDLMKGIMTMVRERIEAMERDGIEVVDPAVPIGTDQLDIKKVEKKIEANRRLLFEIRRDHMNGDIDSSQYEFEKLQYQKDISDAERQLEAMNALAKKLIDKKKILEETRAAFKELSKFENYDDVNTIRIYLGRTVRRIDIDREGKVKVHLYLS